jgi:hypothetical protein
MSIARHIRLAMRIVLSLVVGFLVLFPIVLYGRHFLLG